MNENDLKAILTRNPQLTVSEGIGNTRQVLAKEQKRGTPYALEELAEGEATCLGPPSICFVFRRTRLVDVDALNPKDLIDGLVKAGLLPGDKVGQIILEPMEQIKVAHRCEEETVITIRYE